MSLYDYNNFLKGDNLIELTDGQKDSIIEMVKYYARCMWIVGVKQDDIDTAKNNLFDIVTGIANKSEIDLESSLQKQRDELNRIFNEKIIKLQLEYSDNLGKIQKEATDKSIVDNKTIKNLQDNIRGYENIVSGVSINKDDIISFLCSKKDYGLLEEERNEIADYIMGLIPKGDIK